MTSEGSPLLMSSLHKLPGKYDEGVYGVVFFDEHGFAIKVFRRRTDAPEEHVTKVFQCEVEAYEIANRHQILRNFVPEFFGPIQVPQVLDEAGNDISVQFHLSLAYKMKKVEGTFCKCGITDPQLELIFKEAGIGFTKDASVLLDGESVKCVVDIATQELELWFP